ncbi:MAG: PAS domain S-box protein [Candidatus Aureabacteria bacterium]|nr:PAS domain S-box protein [Candidatus Auribacterota bacterium]
MYCAIHLHEMLPFSSPLMLLPLLALARAVKPRRSLARRSPSHRLHHSEKLCAILLDRANDAILSIDPATDAIVSANRAAESLTRYTVKELLGMKHHALYRAGECDRIYAALRSSPGGSCSLEHVEMHVKGNDRKTIEMSLSLVPYGKGEIILAICRDITQRLVNENRMRQLVSVVEGTSASVIITDLHNMIVYVNPAATKMLGYREDEMLGCSSTTFFEGIIGNPPDLAGIIEREVRHGYWEGDLFNRRKSGEVFPICLRMAAVRNDKGNLIGYAGISEDISRRKQLEEDLIQKEKLSALGELVSAIAHELNNPLTGVLGYAEIIQQSDACPGELQEDLQRLYKEAMRCQCLVKNLLTFARKTIPHKDYHNINELIMNTLDLKDYQFKSDNIELVTALDREIPRCLFDPHQVQQVLLNILNNAHYALLERPAGRRITVTSALRDGSLTVRISNNGPHIPLSRINRIFDPFFSTKEFGKGTGLGLAITHGIVRDHGGKITVESTEGGETAFTVEIPCTGEQPQG